MTHEVISEVLQLGAQVLVKTSSVVKGGKTGETLLCKDL